MELRKENIVFITVGKNKDPFRVMKLEEAEGLFISLTDTVKALGWASEEDVIRVLMTDAGFPAGYIVPQSHGLNALMFIKKEIDEYKTLPF